MEIIKNNIPFMNEMFEKLNIRKDALEFFTKLEEKIMANPELNKIMTDAAYEHMMSVEKDFDPYMRLMEQTAEKFGEHEYTLKYLFTLRCMPYLREQYKEKGYTEEMFWQGADDMRCKLEECLEMYGIYGSFVAQWFGHMLSMDRVALGRFQYILKHYEADTFTSLSGHVIEKDSPVIEFHIPSSGVPLTDEVRNDSYRRAWEFFKDIVGSNRVVLRCTTWLLYPEQYNFLPEKSNIRRFMDDFDIQFFSDQAEFEDAWRIFGKSSLKPLEEWDEKTSIQKAYKKRLLEGKPVGDAMGFIIMENGVNVTKNKNN